MKFGGSILLETRDGYCVFFSVVCVFYVFFFFLLVLQMGHLAADSRVVGVSGIFRSYASPVVILQVHLSTVGTHDINQGQSLLSTRMWSIKSRYLECHGILLIRTAVCKNSFPPYATGIFGKATEAVCPGMAGMHQGTWVTHGNSKVVKNMEHNMALLFVVIVVALD